MIYNNHEELINIIPCGAAMPVICKSTTVSLGGGQMSPDNANSLQIKRLIISSVCYLK